MAIDYFPQEVVEALKCYVYRLIDPRNGETFYVGRGQNQRVFDHARGAVETADKDILDAKRERIHEIMALGMDVAHVIHRHGMSEAVAKEVEAALIDAYPGLVNRVAGSGTRDRGTRHVEEVVVEYSAEEFVVGEPLVLISIGNSWKDRGVYGAGGGMWKMRMERAKKYNLVLAHVRGVVRGAFRPERWFYGTEGNLPYDYGLFPKRIGFEGHEAEPGVRERYVGKRVSQQYRKRGAQTPCRYLSPPNNG